MTDELHDMSLNRCLRSSAFTLSANSDPNEMWTPLSGRSSLSIAIPETAKLVLGCTQELSGPASSSAPLVISSKALTNLIW